MFRRSVFQRKHGKAGEGSFTEKSVGLLTRI